MNNTSFAAFAGYPNRHGLECEVLGFDSVELRDIYLARVDKAYPLAPDSKDVIEAGSFNEIIHWTGAPAPGVS